MGKIKKEKNDFNELDNEENLMADEGNKRIAQTAEQIKQKGKSYDDVYIEEINKEDQVVEDSNKNSQLHTNNPKEKDSKFHISYKIRLIAYGVTFLIIFIATILFMLGAFYVPSSTMIKYNERSNLDYKVHLKNNDFYETDYLSKDQIYIASIIDNVLIDFRYNFDIEKESNVDFTYDIIAKLTINDEITGNNYYKKEYTLKEAKKASIVDDTRFSLYEQVTIDYDYYNSLANDFKRQYGVDTASSLTVYLKVNKQNNMEGGTQAVDTSTMFVKIPLSEKSVNIEMNYQDINNSNYIIENNDSMVDNVILGVLAIISFIISIVVVIKLIRFALLVNGKKSIYDKYVGRILTEYDRLIVENNSGPDFVTNNIIKISRFEELLDVRDNLKLPIMYYVVSKHNKCYFYIKHNRDLYLMTIKAVDLEEEHNEKK